MWIGPRLGLLCLILAVLPLQVLSFVQSHSARAPGVVVRSTASSKVLEDQVQLPFISEEKDQELIEQGEEEAKLMRPNQSPLRAHKVRVSGASGGFGGSSAPSKKKKKKGSKSQSQTKQPPNWDEHAQIHAETLAKEGIIRIDNVLTPKLADALRDYLVDLRQRATLQVQNGEIALVERFADVLHNANRCDLKIPLGPAPVNEALDYILSQTVIRPLVEKVFSIDGMDGGDAALHELNCFMSNTGSRRQLVHYDSTCERQAGLTQEEPVMLTCFVALQDVDTTMGPTAFLPRTHNAEAHEQFHNDKEGLLKSRKNVLGTLPKGCCAVFDPRTLHCATANTCADPNHTRALFYFSFKSPRVAHPGNPSTAGYGINNAELTIRELSDQLEAARQGRVDACFQLNALSQFP